MVLWASLSLLWSKNPGNAGAELWRWYVATLIFLVLTTTISTPAQARMIPWGFLLGAPASVVVGMPAAISKAPATPSSGRPRPRGDSKAEAAIRTFSPPGSYPPSAWPGR
jgi:hypothetical protein